MGQKSNFAHRFFWSAPLRVKVLIYTLVPVKDRDGEEIIFGRGKYLMELLRKVTGGGLGTLDEKMTKVIRMRREK